jgi:hypothetical protein
LEILSFARKISRTQGTSYTMDVAMQLDIPYILHAESALALPVGYDALTRAADETGFFFKAVDILGIGAKKFFLLIKCANEMVCSGRRSRINRLLQLRDERVKYGG